MISVYLGIILLLAVDQLIKWWTVSTLALHTGQRVIDGIFSFYYLQNNGAAWGILSGNMILFYAITLVFVIGFAYWFHKEKRDKWEWVMYSLLMAGALGNFIDRLRLGYVIDMFRFDFIQFPVFNFADVCLTVGVCLLLISGFVLEKQHDK